MEASWDLQVAGTTEKCMGVFFDSKHLIYLYVLPSGKFSTKIMLQKFDLKGDLKETSLQNVSDHPFEPLHNSFTVTNYFTRICNKFVL